MSGLKLNIGCGKTILPGWVNLDNSPSVMISKIPFLKTVLFQAGLINRDQSQNEWPKEIVWCDVSRRIPFPSGSVDKLYSSHFLEHLDREQGVRVMGEAFRVLKKRGIFRLVVPDLVFHVQRYLSKITEPEKAGREPHDELLKNIAGAYIDPKRFGASHRYMYDWPTLRLLLQQAGFERVMLQHYQQSIDAELAILDSRPEDSLHIDTVK